MSYSRATELRESSPDRNNANDHPGTAGVPACLTLWTAGVLACLTLWTAGVLACLKPWTAGLLACLSHPTPTLRRSFRILTFILLLATAGCSENQKPNEALATPRREVNVSELPIKVDQNLAKMLDPLFSSSEFSQARWGVTVISLRDGKLIYEHNGAQLFTPASNMKIYTTAVAVNLLGADYHWRTSVYADSEPDSSGTIHGDLVLYGRGAPDLIATSKPDNSNSLEQLAKALAARGIKHVQGNVVGDESYFRGDTTGQGWQWNDLQWYFGAEASALTINANSIDISITSATNINEPPKVVSNDLDGYVQTTNRVVTVARGEPIRFGVKREISENNVTVWGQYPVGGHGYGASLSVHRPSLWAAMIFLRALKANGISVDGTAQFRDARVPEKQRFKSEGKQELAFVNSKALSEIIRVTNKLSVNLYAELLLRTLGRERGDMLTAENSAGWEPGDDERGTNLVRDWLSRQGIKTAGLALHDGSGLSRLDLVTPTSTAQLLAAIRQTNSARAFIESLPIAGTDGTMGGRLPGTDGRIVAKTGTLTYDHSLSGYLTAKDGQVYAFSVICNDFTGTGSPLKLIDTLVLAIDAYANQQLAGKPSQRSQAKP